jgi:hypothetical protein
VQVKTDFITYSSWLMRILEVSRLPAVAALARSEFHSRIVLGYFLQRNINISNPKVKENAYKALVRPTMEYACTTWDPYQTDFITYSSWLMRILEVSRLPAVAALARSEFHSRIVLGYKDPLLKDVELAGIWKNLSLGSKICKKQIS